VAEEAGAEEAARIGDAGGDAANVAATGDGAAAAYRRARRWWQPWTERAAARWARDEWGKGAGLPGTDAGGRGPWGVREASDDGNWLDAGRPRTGRAGLEGEGEEGNASRVFWKEKGRKEMPRL